MYSGNVLFFDENHTKSSTISCKHIPGTRVCFTTSMIQHSTAEGSQVVRAKTFHKNVNVCVVQLEHTNSSSSRSRQHASMGASSHRLYTSRVRTQPQYQVRVQQRLHLHESLFRSPWFLTNSDLTAECSRDRSAACVERQGTDSQNSTADAKIPGMYFAAVFSCTWR